MSTERPDRFGRAIARAMAAAFGAALWLSATPAWACPQCLGGGSSEMGRAARTGSLCLMGVLVLVLGWIVGVAVFWARRARALEMSRAASDRGAPFASDCTLHPGVEAAGTCSICGAPCCTGPFRQGIRDGECPACGFPLLVTGETIRCPQCAEK